MFLPRRLGHESGYNVRVVCRDVAPRSGASATAFVPAGRAFLQLDLDYLGQQQATPLQFYRRVDIMYQSEKRAAGRQPVRGAMITKKMRA